MQQRSNLQLAQDPENEHACTVRQGISPVRTAFVKSALLELHSRFFNLLGAVIGWVHAAAGYYAAAAMYEDLSRLSDSELTRRGLSRADLARLVGAAYFDGPSSPDGSSH
jgi:hypothetical protein